MAAPPAATISSTERHVSRASPSPSPVSEAPLDRPRLGRRLRSAQQRRLDSLPASHPPRRQRPQRRRHPPKALHLLPADHRHRPLQRRLPVPDPLRSHRHQPRHRIRPAQRPLRPPRAPALFLLPAQPHRRHHGPRHQRPQRRPHAARPSHHVFGEHAGLHRRRSLSS